MRLSIPLAALAAAASTTYGSPVAINGVMACHDFLLPVNASAQTKVLPRNTTIADLKKPGGPNSLMSSAASAMTTGTYTMAGRYCEPSNVVASRRNTLQVLVHGITYDRNYWSGLAPPGTKPGQEQYSWIEYAARQGYPTLSLDRLCNGLSSHPDGLLTCQLSLEADTLAYVLNAARQGQIPGVGRAFSKIINVGHSYGSLIANGMSVKYPKAADALLMTGWSSLLLIGASALIFQPVFLPATAVNPQSPIKDPTYLMVSNKNGSRSIFYYGDYDQSVSEYDFAHSQTVTLGEIISAFGGVSVAPNYTGPVFVLNGNEDTIFCSVGPDASAVGKPGDCQKDGAAQGSKALYPAASSFGYSFIPNTGHCLQQHHTAMSAFKVAHDWLAVQGF